MNRIFLIFLTICISNKIYSQSKIPTFLFAVKPSVDNDSNLVAVPFVMFKNGKYFSIPTCMFETTETKEIKNCNEAKKLMLPFVSAGQILYTLNNGVQNGELIIEDSTEYGFSDWQTYSGKLLKNPNVSVLTNNSTIGKNILKEVTSKPNLKKRKNPEGDILKDKLLTKVDIDGDGFAELIYRSMDYEGTFYQIFSYKNNVWKKVYEGGYQGV